VLTIMTSPSDEPLENLHGVGRFQIDRHAALVAFVQMPEVSCSLARGCGGTLYTNRHKSPVGGSTLIKSARVRQDHRGARPAMSRQVHDLQVPKRCCRSSSLPPESSFTDPRTFAGRFCRKACVPSAFVFGTGAEPEQRRFEGHAPRPGSSPGPG